MTCPRCGRPQPPPDAPGAPRAGATRYCVHCGRVLAGVRWVALPPDALRPREPRTPRRPYTGPPRYPATPRWSLRSWMPAPEPGAEGPLPIPAPRAPDAVLRRTGGLLARVATVTAVLAGLGALAEAVRYGLLVASRSSALPSGPVTASDALVALFGVLAPAAALATGVLFLWWLHQARGIGATLSGTRPARRFRAVVVGSVLPGPNLTVPGSALTELEHAASGLPRDERPRPSAPVRRWWVAWDASVVLGVAAVLRGLGASTQALADSVLLHAIADVAAAVAALATVRVVTHLTELLAPELRSAGREAVLGVGPARSPGSVPAAAEDGDAAGGGRGGGVGAEVG
ncbi:DUF4328 domain-containing protein [Actinomycetospora straminea]|uniref:DUF4328 domain-containing protein n=1 Tax=Actinomycetospora straminea TaxID=663607 RepID=A0ABP9E6V2_9PSEU|nr:DUF4328 domain-containing protein [Actinomycetospora straminea]MDD7932621.1 DUF4328 domain-containing protein [Actinomycetospora straminea]